MRDVEFSLTPFYSPSLTGLERGNNSKRVIRIAPLFFKREGMGVIKRKRIPLSPEGA